MQSGQGSGVAAVADSIEKTISSLGIKTELHSPLKPFSGGYLSQSLRRILFGIKVLGKIEKAGSAPTGARAGAPVVTFDFDGFAMPKGIRFASVVGGILGDIVRFETGFNAIALRLMVLLEKRACFKADTIFAPSEYTRKKIVSLYGVEQEKVKVLHNGIFFDEWAGMVQNSEVESRRPLTVLCVARLYRRKGIDALISAWPDVVSKEPNAILRIVGDGLESANLKHLAGKTSLHKSIIFEGDVRSRSEMASLYANSDIFCLPSLHETFGLVYLEAMAAGIPVVALDSTAVPEVVRDGIDGILVRRGGQGDTGSLAGALADAIVRLLGDADTRKRMGDEGRARVCEKFDWYTVIKPLTEWLEV